MDLMFWLWAALLGLAAAAFAAAPFFLGGRVGIERAATLRALYRQRLDELDDETRSGLLEASERQAMEAELGRALLSDFDDEEPAAKNSRSWAWLVAGLAAPLAAVALYLSIGEPDAPMLSGASHVLRLDPAEDRIELDRWRALLGHRVQRREDDAGSWFLLGRIYLTDEDYAAAAAAFERAHALAGEDPAVDFHWLQARYLAAGGRLDEGAAAIAERILAQTPNQPMVLELLGLEAFRRADYREAVALFNRALANPLDPVPRRLLTTGFTEARARLGDLLPAVDVSVTAKAPTPEGATLFVIARPPGGGMPYAVLRRPASQLPDTFRLDDAVSMNPAAPLSMAEQVEVVVRISRAGTATAHPGDWQWRSKPLAVANAEAPIALQAELKPPS
ncbi:MAG: c-type cytochrome biogenesis protein CcmI [Gammaproteobacteria bacterium]|nr:c-type cytochrome biogenesis protein CcmI [Gammaproteobacteria bacterium]